MESNRLKEQSGGRVLRTSQGLGDKQERFCFSPLMEHAHRKSTSSGVEQQGTWNWETVSRAMAAMGWEEEQLTLRDRSRARFVKLGLFHAEPERIRVGI